jgi:hypothetical protein
VIIEIGLGTIAYNLGFELGHVDIGYSSQKGSA